MNILELTDEQVAIVVEALQRENEADKYVIEHEDYDDQEDAEELQHNVDLRQSVLNKLYSMVK